MNIAMEHLFPVPRETLWHVLHDAERMARFIPGCEKLEEVAPDRYAATLSVGVAGIKGTYTGTVQISQKSFPTDYTLEMDGRATPGFVHGAARMELSEQDDGQTRLSVKADAQVGGLIASVGQRVLTGIARQLMRQMFENIEREVREA